MKKNIVDSEFCLQSVYYYIQHMTEILTSGKGSVSKTMSTFCNFVAWGMINCQIKSKVNHSKLQFR